MIRGTNPLLSASPYALPPGFGVGGRPANTLRQLPQASSRRQPPLPSTPRNQLQRDVADVNQHVGVGRPADTLHQLPQRSSRRRPSLPSAGIEPVLRLAVFDFDNTLAEEHLYHILRENHLSIDQLSQEDLVSVFGGQSRLRSLSTFLETLSKDGVELIIVSLGISDTIKEALRRMDLLQYFKAIYGSDSDELKVVGGAKIRLIRRLIELNQLSHDEVIFCDDDAKNIESRVKLGNGQTVTAADICMTVGPSQGLRHGLTAEHMNKMLAMAGRSVFAAAMQAR